MLVGVFYEAIHLPGEAGRENRRVLLDLRPPPGEPEPFPPLWKQAANLAGAVVAHAAGGFKEATPEERDRRLALCLVCEHWREERCTQCGCYVRAKAAWLEQKCPVGKW